MMKDRKAWCAAVHGITKSWTRLSNWTELMVFLVVMYSCENWTIKKAKCQRIDAWCLQTVVLEKTPENLFDGKDIKPVNLKEDQPWIFTGKTNTEAEAPIFWSSDVNRWLIGKVPAAGKDWGQKEKRMSEDEMVRQHHQCNEHELGQTRGDGEGQGGLGCCSPWGHKESDTTTRGRFWLVWGHTSL